MSRWIRDMRVLRARRRLVAALRLLDRELRAAEMDRAARRRLFREIVADASTFERFNELTQVIR